jgi:molybdopterin molybdotransferase
MPDEHILSYDEAVNVVAVHGVGLSPTQPPSRVPLAVAHQRVLAEDIRTPRALPPFDRATRDGFAVRAAEIEHALHVKGLLRAGQPGITTPLGSREAVEIMTGAPMPPGADAVLMIEHTERIGERICAAEGRTLKAGDNVVPRGSEAEEGSVIVPAGVRLGAAQIAAAASCGLPDLLVFGRPNIAIFATGDELIEPGEPVLDYQIFNSNAYSLAEQVIDAGGEPQIHRALSDDLAATEQAIASAQAKDNPADLLLFSGGVSMGKFDCVETALRNRGAEFFFTGVRIQPGKPLVFGAMPPVSGNPVTGTPQYFFGLPGNPVSTLVTFSLFARLLIAALAGHRDYAAPFVSAALAEQVHNKPGLTRFLPAMVHHDIAGPTVRTIPWQGSGDLAALARSNAFLVIPPDREVFRAGEAMTVLLR